MGHMAKDNTPECFGDPDTVSPIGKEGFPEPQEKCLACTHLKPCLKAAWTKRHPAEDYKFSFEENSTITRISRFCKRWSRLKLEQSEH